MQFIFLSRTLQIQLLCYWVLSWCSGTWTWMTRPTKFTMPFSIPFRKESTGPVISAGVHRPPTSPKQYAIISKNFLLFFRATILKKSSLRATMSCWLSKFKCVSSSIMPYNQKACSRFPFICSLFIYLFYFCGMMFRWIAILLHCSCVLQELSNW